MADVLPQAVAVYRANLIVTGLANCASCTAVGDTSTLRPKLLSCPVLIVPPGPQELPAYVVIAGDFAHFQARQLAWLPAMARNAIAHFDLLHLQPPGGTGLVPLKSPAGSPRLPAQRGREPAALRRCPGRHQRILRPAIGRACWCWPPPTPVC
ncbi:hypothetical protein ACFQT0_29055 [Hymenobacter humi]|uniref:Uncharacterized protein n=1 Tax=Hymenobacter humi TaxID=1411620 RepID=A0ABW2UDW4_9BACT